jgi:hypothetical protein
MARAIYHEPPARGSAFAQAGGEAIFAPTMSASHGATPSSDDHAHETHAHPPMPAIHDEASDTPTWLPLTGVALFVVMVIFALARAALAPAPDAAVTDEQYAGQGEAAPSDAPAQAQ